MSLGFPCSNLHNPVLCIPDNSYNNMWGYVIGDYNCIIRRKTHNVIKPFWYRSIPNKTINPVVYTARLENLYVSKRKPFNKYTHYITENIKLRPLKEDFIVIRQSSILKLLEKLALEYKYQYVIRKAPQKNILPALTSSSSIKDIHLICSIFRVHDVLPSDINNTDGLCIKIHDGNYEYVDIVFSDNKNMYNTDGFEFRNNLTFDEAILTTEKTINMLEKLKSGKKVVLKNTLKKKKINYVLNSQPYTINITSSPTGASTITWHNVGSYRSYTTIV